MVFMIKKCFFLTTYFITFLTLYFKCTLLLALTPPDAGLNIGMSYSEVVKLKGPAAEKSELESKREDIWRYGEITLRFKGGKLVTWSPMSYDLSFREPLLPLESSNVGENSSVNDSGLQDIQPAEIETKPSNERISGLINEIMNELPNEDGSQPSSGAAGPGAHIAPHVSAIKKE